MNLLLQVWKKLIAVNEHKLGKLGESKFIHMTVNGGGIVMFTPTLRCEWMRQTRPDRYKNGLYDGTPPNPSTIHVMVGSPSKK